MISGTFGAKAFSSEGTPVAVLSRVYFKVIKSD